MLDALIEICNRTGEREYSPTSLIQSLIITLPEKINLQICQTAELSASSVIRANLCSKSFLGWSGDAMVLGKLTVPGRPTIWISVGQGPTALAVGACGGCLDIFTLICPFSLSLGDGPI